jgi:uncharacterized protein YjbI with pentapeptide repeats
LMELLKMAAGSSRSKNKPRQKKSKGPRKFANAHSKKSSAKPNKRKRTISRTPSGDPIAKSPSVKLPRKALTLQKPQLSVRKARQATVPQSTQRLTRTKQHPVTQPLAPVRPSKQIITRSDGRQQTIYRNAAGEFISKAKYNELMASGPRAKKQTLTPRKRVVSQTQPVASATSTVPSSSHSVSTLRTSANAAEGSTAVGSITASGNVHVGKIGNDAFPVSTAGEEIIVVNHQEHSPTGRSQRTPDSSGYSEPPLGDFVKDVLKDELPLLHEFLKINVDLLKGRTQAGSAPDTTAAPTSRPATPNTTGNVAAEDSSNALGSVVVEGNLEGGIKVGNTENYYAPPDPEKEIEEEHRKARGKAVLRPEIERKAKEERANKRRPNFSGYDLSHYHLEKIDLSDADLIDTVLEDCYLTGANLRNADLRNADLTNAVLTEAILSGAKLHKAKLIGAQLVQVNLEKADLSEADLSAATVKDARLQGALFDDVIINEKSDLDRQSRAVIEIASWEDPDPVTLKDVPFNGMVLRGAQLANYDLVNFDFTQADLTSADFRYAKLRGARFIQATLYEAKLSDADLQGANLRDAHLGEATLRRAQLNNANLSNADLRGADLLTADLREANLSGANLAGANLRRALVDVQQLEATARSLAGATMPDGSKHL